MLYIMITFAYINKKIEIMKANELRIGNLVSHYSFEGYYHTVIGIKPNGIVILEMPTGFGELHAADSEPITLTEEWLLKFGFEKKIWKVKKSIYFELDKIEILLEDSYYKNGVTYFKSNMLFEYFPKYVHQLQNLYFALTNEELKII